MSTTVEGRSIWCYFGETCGYHSRLEGCSVCPGEACLCQLLTDNFIASIQFCMGAGTGPAGPAMAGPFSAEVET